MKAWEVDAARSALDQGIPVIAEFNTLGSPTAAEPRARMEELLGVRWTRWIGRFFADLGNTEEVPRWMRDNYEREWNRPWLFTGPGYVLLQDDTHCEVLRVGDESKRIGLTINRAEPVDPLLQRARDKVPYPYWFDIVEAAPGTEVLAWFDWQLTGEGEARLADRGLPTRFPRWCAATTPAHPLITSPAISPTTPCPTAACPWPATCASSARWSR